MKKNYLICVFLLSSFSIYAQTTKGTIALSANVDFSSTSTTYRSSGISVDGPTSNQLAINVGIAFFVADKVAIGANVGFANVNQENTLTDFSGNTYTEKSELSGPDFGLVFRYYFGGNESLSFFAGASGDYFLLSGDQTTSLSNVSIDQKENTIHAGLNGGIVFFPAKKIGIEASIGFIGINNVTSSSGSGNSEIETSNDTFNVELFKAPLQFAFVWYLGAK